MAPGRPSPRVCGPGLCGWGWAETRAAPAWQHLELQSRGPWKGPLSCRPLPQSAAGSFGLQALGESTQTGDLCRPYRGRGSPPIPSEAEGGAGSLKLRAGFLRSLSRCGQRRGVEVSGLRGQCMFHKPPGVPCSGRRSVSPSIGPNWALAFPPTSGSRAVVFRAWVRAGFGHKRVPEGMLSGAGGIQEVPGFPPTPPPPRGDSAPAVPPGLVSPGLSPEATVTPTGRLRPCTPRRPAPGGRPRSHPCR